MADLTSMSEASLSFGGFYVPQFQILVEGSELPGEVLRDVIEITYRDKLEEIDSCELTVNNWDPDFNRFKYIGSEDLNEDGEPNTSDPGSIYWTIFDPCSKNVELRLGYAGGSLEQMMQGNFVTCEPTFPASGAPLLAVRMLNRMHKLRSARYSTQFTTDKINPLTDSAIAKYLSTLPDANGNVPRFPIPIQIDDNAIGDEPQLTYVIQKNQYDVDFLWQRARMRGYDVHIDGEQDSEQLFFGPSTAPDRPTYQLEWGQSLIDFRPTLSSSNQCQSVSVNGWDRAAQQPIKEKVDLKDPDLPKVNKDLHYLLDKCNQRDESVAEEPIYTKEEARSRAVSVLGDQLKRMVLATGTTIGLPLLRAGSHIQIGSPTGSGKRQTLGSRLSGLYFVTSTTHTLNDSGYTTRFEARREDEGDSQ